MQILQLSGAACTVSEILSSELYFSVGNSMSYLNLPDILKILILHTDMHMVTFLNYLQIAKLILITNYFTLHVLYCMLVLKHFSYIKLPNYSPGEIFEKVFLFFLSVTIL